MCAQVRQESLGEADRHRVAWSVENDQFVAACPEFPSLSWLADTKGDALHGLAAVIAKVVDDLRANREPVPDPLSSRAFSGKFNLRVGVQLDHGRG